MRPEHIRGHEDPNYRISHKEARRAGIAALAGLAATIGALSFAFGEGTKQDSGPLDCFGEQKVYVPQGSNFSELADEYVDFDRVAISPEMVADEIEQINDTYIAPAEGEVIVPLNCKKNN